MPFQQATSGASASVDPRTSQFTISNTAWPQVDVPGLVVESNLRHPVASPLRYAPPRVLANITDATQITKSGNASGTVTNDTSFGRANAPATVILGSPGSNNQTIFRAPVSGTTFDVRAGTAFLRLPMKISGANNITTLKLAVSSDGFTTANYSTVVISTSTLTWLIPNAWGWYGWAQNDFTAVGTGADFSALNCVRWEVTAAGATGALTVEVGPVLVCPVQTSKALAVLSFDDGYQSSFIDAAKRMSAYGFPGVLFPNPKQIGWDKTAGTGALAVAEFQALRDLHGWQIATHQWSNADHNSWQDSDTLEYQFNQIKEWQLAMGVARPGADDYAWSGVVNWTGGVVNSTVDPTTSNGVHYQWPSHWDIVRKRFRTARSTFGKGNSGETWPPADPYRIRCFLSGGDTWNTGASTDPKVMVDKAIACKGIFFGCWHNNLTSTAADATVFDSLLAYLDANRSSIEVVTLDTAVARANALS